MKNIWYEYVYGKQTYKELAQKYDCSPKTIQRYLKKHQLNQCIKLPRDVVLLIDTTYWRRTFGVMVFKDAESGETLLRYYVKYETNSLYLKGINELIMQGFRILAVVCDGRKGLAGKLKPLPIQLCQFHQISTITRYLSKHPKHQSGKDLKLIVGLIPEITQMQLEDFLEQWLDIWKDYYNERGVEPDSGQSFYIHRRLRSAFRSLRTNIALLFTYQKYPSLKIPNTTNKLDGSFAYLKQRLGCHNGLSTLQMKKFIDDILGVSK
ncbi:hypothetical protein FHQ28_06625 [Pasteurellaceae bacterium USgator11]|nr:hypothetical protein FHQ19_04315 [Pasteurellaceae bacterium UScroc12]TNG97146.1 hypothetical protein FHQ20_03785 [Pasteurellaceae bacterium USgator41]TNH01151.1 hypothetical protein FHQ28_06625 [Pasteurellaceae bacterium USgator11]TNH01892.1 hypothetical protein FHQ24_00140 [Pasteurellaceae bacterium UScroc31]